ncbi:MAG: peptide MFS transporter [Candidatus Riflebacteria bacterium]|nr:peptide MFS transporter [Candidatus Riflebacteria bacterium]
MTSSSEGHPKGLYLLFTVEMWERFSYYGMRAILTLFMIKALLFDKPFASSIYGSYTGLVYLTPLLGGYMSDRYFGNRRSIIIGSIMMALGQFMLFGSGFMVPSVPVKAETEISQTKTVASQSPTLAASLQNASIATEGNTSAVPSEKAAETSAASASPSAALPAITTHLFYIGLVLLILGNGFFKPNISTMVGQLYPAGDKRVDSAFTIFYMGINLGALFSPLVCGTLGDTGNPADFKFGFLAAGIGMVISLISFIIFKDRLLVTPEGKPVGMPPVKQAETSAQTADVGISTSQLAMWGVILVVLFAVFKFVFKSDLVGSLIFSAMLVVPGMIITDKGLSSDEKERIWVIFILAFFVIFFWSAFEQAGASLTYFADEQTNRSLFGKEVPASYFQSVNPVAIIIFAPLFTLLWGWLSRRGLEPSSPLKMAFGLLLLSISYGIIALGVKGIGPGTKVSMMWLLSLYLIQTFGELSLSPIGLSMVSKLAPTKFASLLMGTWFLSNAAANKFAGILSALYPPGPLEFKQAMTSGIDLPSILTGKLTATADQIKILADMGLSNHYPSLIGYQITSLFDFFVIFIVLSGLSALLLFGLYKKLIKMMHGVN